MILVSGYYGFHNSGDEAVLAALCADLEALGFKRTEIIVLSEDPAATAALHGVQAVPRANFQAVVKAMRSCRFLISGGGSLLQDSTSWRTVPYYLLIIHTALVFGLKVVVYGQGIGPVKNWVYQRWIARVYRRVQGISVRDAESADQLRIWGVTNSLITTAADPVFNLPLAASAEQIPGITINLRPYPGWPDDLEQWADLFSTWTERFQLPIRFAALGPGDAEIGHQLQRDIPAIELNTALDWYSAYQLMSQTEISVSMRLHGLIFAAVGGSLPIGLNYDPKVAAVGGQLGIKVRSATPNRDLTTVIGEVMAEQENYRNQLLQRLEQVRQQSTKNRTVLAAVLLNNGGRR